MSDDERIVINVRTWIDDSTPRPPRIEVRGELRGGRIDAAGKQIHFDHAHLVDVDLSNQKTEHFTMEGGLFERCDFRRLRFPTGGFGGTRDQTVVRDCTFDGANLTAAGFLDDVRFERCSFRNAKIRGWRGWKAEFIDCVFEGRLSDVMFCGRAFDPYVLPKHPTNEFRGNDFRSAVLDGVDFSWGIDVFAQQFPDNGEYVLLDRAQERLRRAREVVEAWPADDFRRRALLWLESGMKAGSALQESMMERRQRSPLLALEELDRLIAVLREVVHAD